MTEALTILAAVVLFAAFVWAQISANEARRTLANLRRNAWLRNERGQLQPYEKCSPQTRARHEANPSEKEA